MPTAATTVARTSQASSLSCWGIRRSALIATTSPQATSAANMTRPTMPSSASIYM